MGTILQARDASENDATFIAEAVRRMGRPDIAEMICERFGAACQNARNCTGQGHTSIDTGESGERSFALLEPYTKSQSEKLAELQRIKRERRRKPS